jgi:nucleoid DNA-binding protein
MPKENISQRETTKQHLANNILNADLVKEVAAETKFSPKEVEEMVNEVTKFTAKIIKSGNMGTVRIPFFGKFRPKVKQIQWLTKHGITTRG